MGGGYYEREVETSTSTTGSSAAASAAMTAYNVATDCNPATKSVTCTHRNPVVIVLDVSGSMSDWPRIIWDKLPMFYGQIMMQGYLEDPALCFCAVDDVDDRAPLQVSDFSQGNDIDAWLKKIWLEGGGGGPADEGCYACEAYDIAAFYFAHRCRMVNANKPILFFCADEGPRRTVNKAWVKRILDIDIEANIPTKQIFAALRKKFNVFLLKKPLSGYDEQTLPRWVEMIGEERIVRFDNPKAVVDVMLGCIALVHGKRTLDAYKADMTTRGQTTDRIAEVSRAISHLALDDEATNCNS